MEVNENFSKLTPGIRSCRLEALSNTGQVFISELQLSAKDIETGLTESEIKNKFFSLCGKVMKTKAIKELYKIMQDIENLEKVSTVVEKTRI